ncbi:MAG TPA: PfkB family carbohydrate kinase [Pyrinomonadaceae bacterium]|jgi:rfaE bifunctional protein kinase chain/domain
MAARQARLAGLVREFARCRVVVVGDAVADQFLYGEISRVSREAPVLILRHERTETVPGGAANCAANLAALGAQAALVGVVGPDESGRALLGQLQALGVDCENLLSIPTQTTATKVRILAGHAHSTRQQVIRVDYEGTPLADADTKAQLAERLHAACATADAVIISDYNYGVACAEVIESLRTCARARKFPVLVDSRFRLLEFAGFTSGTPNEDEVEQVLGRRLTETTLDAAAAELCARLDYAALLVTRGPHGMVLLERGRAPVHLPAVGASEAVDVTGAGDTVIATYTLALARGASFADAAHLANHAGGLVVMKRGTATAAPNELLASVLENDEAGAMQAE